ncbi:hypothetical protein ID866_8723 [Astraeus odoratus]|nr:hypothetical protein ID866_8723 [Astraeus odoratus]
MWIVTPEVHFLDRRFHSVIALDTTVHGAHLLGVCRDKILPSDFHFSYSLDTFNVYYVNKYIDHHVWKLEGSTTQWDLLR